MSVCVTPKSFIFLRHFFASALGRQAASLTPPHSNEWFGLARPGPVGTGPDVGWLVPAHVKASSTIHTCTKVRLLVPAHVEDSSPTQI